MQPFNETVQTTRNGVVVLLPSPTVTVKVAGSGALATIFADNAGTPKSNPFVGSIAGEVSFHAANGRYDVEITKPGFGSTVFAGVVLNDPEDGTPGALVTLDDGRGGDLFSQAQEFADYAVESFAYAAPAITALTIDGQPSKTVEKGTSVASVALAWTLTGSTPTGQSISNGVGTVPVGTTTKTATGPYTTSQTFTLTVTDVAPNGDTKTTTAAVALNVLQKRYWGVSASTSLNSAGVLGLAGSEFATARGKTVTYDATGGRYPYFAYPASFGALSSVKVNGLAFSDFTTSTVSFTNASGATENYLVTRFNNLQNGASISVEWA